MRFRILITLAALCVLASLISAGMWGYYVRIRPVPVDLTKFTFPFNRDEGQLQDIPAWIRRLDGREIVVEACTFQQDHSLTKFYLFATDPQGWPLLSASIDFTTEKLKPVPDFRTKVRVVGRLHVGVTRDAAGHVDAIFSMDVKSIELASTPVQPMPRWPIFLAVTGLLLTIAFLLSARIRRHRRIATGCCTACGYDLRASRERCPECGQIRSQEKKIVAPAEK